VCRRHAGFSANGIYFWGGIEAQQWGFVTALLVCTLINVALFFRVFDKGLYVHSHKKGPDITGSSNNPHAGEAPLSMLLPAIILALAILLIGIFNQFIMTNVIHFAVPVGL